MSLNSEGRRKPPISERSQARNAAALSRFRKQCAVHRKRRATDEPERQFRMHSPTASQEMKKLEHEIDRAKAFQESIGEMKENGELDDQTAGVCRLPARIGVMLFDLLVVLHRQAETAESGSALSSIGTAADTLRRKLERQMRYCESLSGDDPLDEVGEREAVIRMIKESAEDMYVAIMETLESTPRELGVPVPEYPAES